MSGFTGNIQLVYVLATAGMMIAGVATLVLMIHDGTVTATGWIVLISGALIGSAVGLYAAQSVQMTAMPQLVSMFNSVGGGAAALVAIYGYINAESNAGGVLGTTTVFTVLDVIIGSVTFSGSIIAAGKLQGLIGGQPIIFRGSRLLNAALAVAAIGAAAFMLSTASLPALLIVVLAALAFGVMMVLPIGGADMPVVISLLNAFTGTAVAMAGFVIGNWALIVAGALVGASGGILTKLMADAMNRSLVNIIVGGFGTGDSAAAVEGAADANIRSIAADDAAIQLAYASKVIIVPGYGLAAAQAQHGVAELAKTLEERGIEVSYAIHPVAGRMPGHMNVLLAEANVPYPQLKEMEENHPEFRPRRRGPGHRGQRRDQPGRPPPRQRGLRHADPGRGPGQVHHRDQAVNGARLRRHRQRAVLRSQDQHVLRRRQEGDGRADGRRQDPRQRTCWRPSSGAEGAQRCSMESEALESAAVEVVVAERTKIPLDEPHIPRQWYNVIPDLPAPPPPPLHPGTLQPVGPEDLAPLFPMALIRQEVATDSYIDIPAEVLDVDRLWRPTPLYRAHRLEKALGTPAHIFYKYEGGSPAGSHKPNPPVPQAHYNAAEGTKRLTTETGAGQWGSALAFACAQYGIDCEIWMVRASYDQKPYRRTMMETWGATVHASPSRATKAGADILAADPDSPGSLGIAISEAVEAVGGGAGGGAGGQGSG